MRLQSDLFFVCATLREVFAADTVCCVLLDGDTDELVVVAADGQGAAATLGARMASDAGLIGYVATEKVAVDVPAVRADRRYLRQVSERTGYHPTSLMGAPMLGADDCCLGLISVMDAARDATDGDLDLALLLVAAAQVASLVTSTNPEERGQLTRSLPPDDDANGGMVRRPPTLAP